MPLLISAAFDGGNITVVDASSPQLVKLALRPEPFTHGTDKRQHAQWFSFKASGLSGTTTFQIGGLLDSSYPQAWSGYTMNASFDRINWFRIQDTTYDEVEGVLEWKIDATHPQVYFSYFAPYSFERHCDLLSKCMVSPLAQVETLGHTLDGRDMDCIIIGTGSRKVWLAARQHPGETMAEWLAEGFLARLLDPIDPQAMKLRQLATIYCVPNMNPDGSVRGHLRTNACG